MTVEILTGDCRKVLAAMEPESFHACVCDPPYHLVQASRNGSAQPGDLRTPHGRSGPSKQRGGFMGKNWDGGDVAFRPETWAAVWRVLKPGAYLLAFSGCRTYHRMVCAIEDAGFIIHPMFAWHFGQGFPKAHKVGAEGWEGWRYGVQSIKPAMEPICMAQKPFSEATGTANVLKHGCGAVNVDASRVAVEAGDRHDYGVDGDEGDPSANTPCYGKRGRVAYEQHQKGRWPANVVHDGSPEVMEAFARFGETGAGHIPRSGDSKGIFGNCDQPITDHSNNGFGDTGTAARFFKSCEFEPGERFMYCAKATAEDRCGSSHPTVKPVALMEWLVRMVTPPGGRVVDPFCGTGSTLVAADRLGFDAVGIDADPQSVADAERKLQVFRARRMIGDAPNRAETLPGQMGLGL